MLVAAASIAVIVWAMYLAQRFRPIPQRSIATLANRIQEPEVVRRRIGRARGWTPSGYLALHLTLGLVLAITFVAFATLAEGALVAGELVAFDLAFARALHDARSPEWQRAFLVV
jgi:hypothetical protein